jgi:hypothetical protein
VITTTGCEPLSEGVEDLTEIHDESIVLEAWTETRSSLISFVNVCSHGEDEFSFPGRVFGRVALFAASGRFLTARRGPSIC